MALSEAQIKKNKEANKKAKEKQPFRGYSAAPSKEEMKEMKKKERSAKNKLAATAMADTEVEATISAFEGDLKRAKTFNEKDKVLARFLKRVEAARDIRDRNKAKAQKNIEQYKRDNKEIEAGIDRNKVLDRQKRLTKKTGGKVMKRAGGGMLKGNQKKLDADGSGTITANDFQKLRNRDKMVSKKYGGRMMKRAGGGMTYQLYGGSSKNIHDGNTEISQFYDTKN